MEGRKEGGGGRRAEPRQLEFLRRKDRAREERAFSRFRARDGPDVSPARAHSLRPLVFPDDGEIGPLSRRFLSSRSCEKRAIGVSCQPERR